jgi:nicotinamidase-related amidase
MSTAVVVIDVQESFRQRPYWDPALAPPYLAAQNRLVEGARSRGLPLVRVFHVDEGPFALASGFVTPLRELTPFEAALTVHKNRHSALVGTPLEPWLIRQGIRRLVVSGIRTEQCCETTARHASDLGFEVDYVTEATLTFPMTHASGLTLTADELKVRTEVVLSGRFATVCSVEQALARAS